MKDTLEALLLIVKQRDQQYPWLWEQERLQMLMEGIVNFMQQDFLWQAKAPFFEEECIPESLNLQPWKTLIERVQSADFDVDTGVQLAQKAVSETPVATLLILMGQRLTSASLQDEQGIPPLNHDVIMGCFQPYNSEVTKAVRAWEKHTLRSEDSFWGIVKGNRQEKEQFVKRLVTKILEEKTWWNVFYHYKHQVVYEVRLPNGYGFRVQKERCELIGFLEPFLENQQD